jgi:uncharacterized membrane protein
LIVDREVKLMKTVIDWIWNGPWWAPLVGAIYAAVVLGIAFGPFIGAMRGARNK